MAAGLLVLLGATVESNLFRSGAPVLGEYAAILAHGPVDRLVGAHAACDLCAHVREHERRDDLLDRRRERPRVTRKANEVREVLEDLELGIRADDRHRLLVGIAEEGHVVATTP